ncbi:TIM-barrel signal transduction protein-domain-containing protein [Lasiosphaeria hispida]|uniref:TIM-barrel signal transduction protein-domain-containing protein n=1 Tax=Lasiosphaeria hispida TaxID=260671 RepID=A0AAJ0HUL4_9PEZI|nr:TIM-barrel signal transduction protein-domain-containing protein [Lasiosphaeria hispida]
MRGKTRWNLNGTLEHWLLSPTSPLSPLIFTSPLNPTNNEMAPPTNREEILNNLRQQISLGKPIVGAGAGIGLSTGKSLDECVRLVQEIRDAAVAVRPDAIVLCHGGPIATPDDAAFVLARTVGVHGFYGASSMERLPVEQAITDITRQFKGVGGKSNNGNE